MLRLWLGLHLSKRMLRFELILPENPEEMTTLMRMIIYCIDYVPSLRLSAVVNIAFGCSSIAVRLS